MRESRESFLSITHSFIFELAIVVNIPYSVPFPESIFPALFLLFLLLALGFFPISLSLPVASNWWGWSLSFSFLLLFVTYIWCNSLIKLIIKIYSNIGRCNKTISPSWSRGRADNCESWKKCFINLYCHQMCQAKLDKCSNRSMEV